MTQMKPGPAPIYHDAPPAGTDQPYRRPGEEHLIGRIVHAVANVEGQACTAAILTGHSDAPPAGPLYIGMEPAMTLQCFPVEQNRMYGADLEWRFDPKGTLIFTYHWPRSCPFGL